MDPSNMRKEKEMTEKEENEEKPIGFLTSSTSPLSSAVEMKPSYNFNDTEGDFVRADLNVFKKFGDTIKLGGGLSGFGNLEDSFYDKETAYGLNLYVDVLDIFRFTYVRRHGGLEDNNYFYLGIENIPSLFYWLYR